MFKIGDKVRCVDNDGRKHSLKIGELYEITSVEYDYKLNDTYVGLKNGTLDYLASRFEKVLDNNESEELENTKRYKTNSGKHSLMYWKMTY